LDNPERYLMIPYSELLPPKPKDYNTEHPMDFDPVGWKIWKTKNVPNWSELSQISNQTGR